MADHAVAATVMETETVTATAVVTCQGFVNKNNFSNVCKNCGRTLQQHPAVRVDTKNRLPDERAWTRADAGLLRWTDQVLVERLQKNCIPALERVKAAWKLTEALVEEEHHNLCVDFLQNVPFSKSNINRGCCHRMGVQYTEMESLIYHQTKCPQAKKLIVAMEHDAPKALRQYGFLMRHWRSCKADMLEYDEKIKKLCGRSDFLNPGVGFVRERVPAPVYEDIKQVTVCRVCESKFGLFSRRKLHCAGCARVVCEKCAPMRSGSEDGPVVRLCIICLPF